MCGCLPASDALIKLLLLFCYLLEVAAVKLNVECDSNYVFLSIIRVDYCVYFVLDYANAIE